MADMEAHTTPPKPETTTEAVVIRPWPKIIMMVPTLIATIVCGLITFMADEPDPADKVWHFVPHGVSLLFLAVLFINLVLLLYDLNLKGFIIVLLTICIGILLLYLLDIKRGGVWERLGHLLSLKVYANAAFYYVFAVVLFINLIIAWIITRFHYWVVERNEIIIHNGFMHEQERHPTSTARFRLQVDDVIEYAIFGAGTLVFTFADDKTERVLSTVLRVRVKARHLDVLLGRMAVTEQ